MGVGMGEAQRRLGGENDVGGSGGARRRTVKMNDGQSVLQSAHHRDGGWKVRWRCVPEEWWRKRERTMGIGA